MANALSGTFVQENFNSRNVENDYTLVDEEQLANISNLVKSSSNPENEGMVRRNCWKKLFCFCFCPKKKQHAASTSVTASDAITNYNRQNRANVGEDDDAYLEASVYSQSNVNSDSDKDVVL